MIYDWNGNTTIGLGLLLYAILIIIFPPKFGNDRFGIFTKMTMRTKEIWLHGQRLLAYSLLIIGLIFLIISLIEIENKHQYFFSILLLFTYWKLTKYIIDKILLKKYPI